MAVSDEELVSRLQDGAAPNATDNSDEPFALQSLCMSCYENVRLIPLDLPHTLSCPK